MPAVHFEQSILHYQVFGQGPRTLLLFHGFGQDSSVFKEMAEALQEHFTCYSFDLFFHGASARSKGDTALEKETWANALQQFLAENNIGRFSVLGFSLGARFALTAAEAFAARIDHLVLLAPDGIRENGWYRLATSSSLLRAYFKGMIANPSRFTRLIQLARRLRLAPAPLLRFAESQMNTEEKRWRVYHAWVVFRQLRVELPPLADLLKKNNVQTAVILASHDHVITADSVQPLVRHLPAAGLHVVNARHHGLIDASIPLLSRLVSL